MWTNKLEFLKWVLVKFTLIIADTGFLLSLFKELFIFRTSQKVSQVLSIFICAVSLLYYYRLQCKFGKKNRHSSMMHFGLFGESHIPKLEIGFADLQVKFECYVGSYSVIAIHIWHIWIENADHCYVDLMRIKPVFHSINMISMFVCNVILFRGSQWICYSKLKCNYVYIYSHLDSLWSILKNKVYENVTCNTAVKYWTIYSTGLGSNNLVIIAFWK